MRYRPEQRLRLQGDIKSVRERGFRSDCSAFTVWALRRPPESTLSRPRAGVIASTAAVGGAIQRNRAKRRLRELFRQHQSAIPAAFDLLLIARRPINRCSFADLERSFGAACARIAQHA